MHLTGLDWAVVLGCVIIIFAPALFFARRAGKSMSEFFTSGQSAPWWLIGTSMVATTFSTDTPGLVAQLVREQGVAGNWCWWAFLLTGLATVFFYARLWRRSGVLTDLEFYEIRYSGKAAATVRGFRSIYLGLVYNCFIMATVTLAAVKIAAVLFGIEKHHTIMVSIVLCIAISTVSGLWGVLVSDLIQFGIAIAGSFVAMYFALNHASVGGLQGLMEKIDPSTLAILPEFKEGSFVNWPFALTVLIIPLTIQWWAVWYPGSEPGGGSYIAQRILAAKNEKHAMGATLWFNIAHYALRPWPWILVALSSILVFPQLTDIHAAFPKVDPEILKNDAAYSAMLTFIPSGLLGLVVASLLAAFVSTISTHLNWGASYLVSDFYKRFLQPNASEHHYVMVSRFVTAGLMCVAGGLVYCIDSARDGFNLLMSIGAGTGLIYLLRWFWWRINAWSEISAMIASFFVSIAILILNKQLEFTQPCAAWVKELIESGWLTSTEAGLNIPPHTGLIITVAITTPIWIIVTYLTRPVPRETLVSFYKLTRPAGPGWSELRNTENLESSPDSLAHSLLAWVLGCLAIYSVLFGVGSLIFNKTTQGFIMLVISAASAIALLVITTRSGRSEVMVSTKAR